MTKAGNIIFGNESNLLDAERAILLIDQRFQYSAKATNDAIYDLDLTTNRIYWSDTYETIFGFSLDDTESELQTWNNRIHPHDRKNIAKSLDKAIENRKPFWQEEYRYLCADGSYKFVCDRGYIFYDVDSTPRRMIGAMQDITERKNSEEEITLKTAYLQELFDASPLGIVMLDPRDKIIKANAGFTQLFQYSSEEITGKYLNDVLATPELQEEATAISLSCINKKPISVESKRKRKDGELIDVQIIGYPIVVNNRLKGIYGIYSDISDRKTNEESLRSSEKQFRTLVNTMNEGLMQLDNEARVLYVNKRLCEMTGYTVRDLVSNNVFKLLFDFESYELLTQKLIERKKGFNDKYELKLRKKTGECIWVMISAAPITNEAGEITGSMGTFTDITGQKENELVLQRKNNELRKINAELDRFVYSASHEMRAPLTSILGLVNLLELNNATDAETTQCLAMMRQSVQRLDGFIQDIVHYSRNARLNVEYEKVDLPQIINEAIHNLKFMEGANTINYYIETEPVTFYSDVKSISVIVNNLVSNSIKYHNYSNTELHIRVAAKMLEDKVTITVEDNGQGIEEQYHDKIFNMFFRATENAKGSGLGLYIVKEIVDKLKGNISVESAPGKGSKFTITLPRRADNN